MAAISLRVNGRTRDLDVDPDTPLLYVLSDEAGVNGASLTFSRTPTAVQTLSWGPR